jgi:hypothetical protein
LQLFSVTGAACSKFSGFVEILLPLANLHGFWGYRRLIL